MKKWILAILTAIMLCGACAQADYQTGWEAESAGDIELAFELWEKAAAQGDADSAYALGYRYQIGTYGEVDYAKAMEYFKIAAEQNLPRGQYAVGLMYRKGQGVQQDNAAALEWYLKAAALGHGTAMNNIGLIYKEQGDYAAAMEWYLKAYASGYDGMDGAPCTNIGQLYHNGQGVEQDYEKAMEWYLLGAQAGSAVSARNIGLMYYHAEGVEKDYAMAAQWFEKSLELDPDYFNAIEWLGCIYRQKEYGMTPDYEKAELYLQRAAGLGSAVAACNIGIMYYHAEGVEKDYAMAAQWFEKSLELDPDYLEALEWLGYIYRQNEYGMTPDVVLTEAEGVMQSLGELTGRSIREDVTNRIFQRFCVGK